MNSVFFIILFLEDSQQKDWSNSDISERHILQQDFLILTPYICYAYSSLFN